MADMKIPGVPHVARPMSGARAEAIRNAQKAFFNAATTQAQTPQAPTAKPDPRPVSKALAVTPAPEQDMSEPRRYLRPGSRVDIKV